MSGAEFSSRLNARALHTAEGKATSFAGHSPSRGRSSGDAVADLSSTLPDGAASSTLLSKFAELVGSGRGTILTGGGGK